MRRRSVLPLLMATALPALGQGYDASALVTSARGELPLILSAPHDGTQALASVPSRVRGTTVRDLGTGELALRVAALIGQRTGRRPYVLVANFSRKFVDANRAEQDAIESPVALPAYRAYHDTLAGYVAEVRARFPAGALLVDVHGQGQVPDTTFRGTRGGLTTRALLARSGHQALQGERSLVGQLAARGYKVHPAVDAGWLVEDSRFAGGYTVAHYGSQNPEGIDAIQLEFGTAQRASPRLAEDLADALIAFLDAQGMMPK